MHNLFCSFVFLKSLKYKKRKCARWYDNDGVAFVEPVIEKYQSTTQSHSSIILRLSYLVRYPICPNLAEALSIITAQLHKMIGSEPGYASLDIWIPRHECVDDNKAKRLFILIDKCPNKAIS